MDDTQKSQSQTWNEDQGGSDQSYEGVPDSSSTQKKERTEQYNQEIGRPAGQTDDQSDDSSQTEEDQEENK